MNFSVWMLRRKWPCGLIVCGQTAMVGALALGVLVAMPPKAAQARQRTLFTNPLEELFQPPRRSRRLAPTIATVPLPMPRPIGAPQSAVPAVAARPAESASVPSPTSVPIPEPRPAEAPGSAAAPAQAALPPQTPPVPAEPPPPSACRVALTEQIAVAPSIPDITGPGSCGGVDLVRLEAVVVPGKGKVSLKPAATLRCEMATAVAGWIRDDMAPLAATLGTTLAELDNFDSFDCRGRNRVKGAKMSEHGRANALDVRGLTFANGQAVSLTDPAAARDTREKVLQSVCGRFTTVLGPGSDGYHEDHIHLDIAERRSGYRICQWMIYEPMPQVAPLMPAERPAEAPPREIAESKTQGQPAVARPPSNAEEEAEPDLSPSPKPAKTARKRRSAY